jgi:YbgC/YbaW family acyl-CoA thioester hydrolase
MGRIKIDLPAEFRFTTVIPVRISDINYGGHVGNDAILSLLHEARMQYLAHYGYTEMQFAGVGMIMSDVAISFKNELFYGDTIKASVTIGELSGVAFELYYKLEKEANGSLLTAATAKTGMVCYDYTQKKIVAVPPEIRGRLLA